MRPYLTSFTPSLIRHVLTLARGPLDEDVVVLAKQCVLDWVGVALVGAREPITVIARKLVEEEGGRRKACALGARRRVNARQAAFINGTAGHALDYDDVSMAAHGHVTATVLPAAMALAETRRSTGRALLGAFVAGYEASCVIGNLVGPSHYERGFHATGTLGSFGAAVAAGSLLELGDAGMTSAVSIAGSMASGLKAQFGTMCKPLHAGKASENGILSAQLAARGVTSRLDMLEALQGFCSAFSSECNIEYALGSMERDLHLRANLFKYHASCFGTHGAVQLLHDIHRQHAIRYDQIRRVELRVDPGADAMCNVFEPKTGLEAQFSLRFNAALAIAGVDTGNPHTYSDATTRLPELCAIRDLVEVKIMPSSWPRHSTEAIVELLDGQVICASVDMTKPSTDLLQQGVRLQEKFLNLVSPSLGERLALNISECIGTLDELENVKPLSSLLWNSSNEHRLRPIKTPVNPGILALSNSSRQVPKDADRVEG